jgi:UDP-glucose 4-epimerase
MSVLVTGGAGYIGSHMTYALIDRGEAVVVLDDLSTGVRDLVSEKAAFVQGDAGDQAAVRRIIQDHGVDSVIHFAGSIVVPESVSDPLLYYAGNTMASRSLIEACVKEGVKHFVFSSTAAVYGSPQTESVSEASPTVPINPYGRSKLMTEWILEDVSRAHRPVEPEGDASHQAGEPGGARASAPSRYIRDGFSDARRDGNPRLHPCDGSGRGASAGARRTEVRCGVRQV